MIIRDREEKLIRVKIENEWPEAISDGLNISCAWCGRKVFLDYAVKDEIWKKVVPPADRPKVICIDCFLKEALRLKIDVGTAFEDIQIVTGAGQTIQMLPTVVFHYEDWINE